MRTLVGRKSRRCEIDFENAKADAETAIRLSPTLSGAHAFLGYAFAKQGDFDRATAEIGEAFRLDPRSLDALLYRGELHLLRGEPRRALDDFEAALVRRPVFPLAIAGRDAAKKALATEIATSSSPREPQPAPGPPAAPTQNLGTAQTDSLSIDQSTHSPSKVPIFKPIKPVLVPTFRLSAPTSLYPLGTKRTNWKTLFTPPKNDLRQPAQGDAVDPNHRLDSI